MKLNIEGSEIIVDFEYENSYRELRKGDISINKLRSNCKAVPTIITTCTITLDNGCVVAESVKCDAKYHNRYFARKYSLKKVLSNWTKDFRTKVWKAYWDYVKPDKIEYLGIDGFGFQNIRGLIIIDCDGKEITLTPIQHQKLLKLLE